MKKIFINTFVLMLLAMLNVSCLEGNLDDLDTYKGNDIMGVSGVFHRYYGPNIIPGSGEQEVLQTNLNFENFQSNPESGTCSFDFSIPTNFPEDQKSKFDPKNMVVALNISTASICKPIEGSAQLGIPADWTKPNKYLIIAANGDEKVWTVTANYKR